ncbi:MAG TPA: nucleotide exchange factor GrpE [Candidatus Bathyarchaeia archaeon]|nr:nucleotide exchange factor GrpE [Candidatus Bathyarchaeia archaeon]
MRNVQKKVPEAQKNEEKDREEANVEATSTDLERLQAKLEEKTALADEYLSRLKYLQADFENYKKMVAREREMYEQCATEELIKRLLPIIDTLEAGFASAKQCEDLMSFVKGIELTYNDLMDMLGKEGLKPINAVGEKFDPYKHEVTMSVINDDHPEDTILEELERGYTLGAKVIRTSKVGISKKAAPRRHTTQNSSDK